MLPPVTSSALGPTPMPSTPPPFPGGPLRGFPVSACLIWIKSES